MVELQTCSEKLRGEMWRDYNPRHTLILDWGGRGSKMLTKLLNILLHTPLVMFIYHISIYLCVMFFRPIPSENFNLSDLQDCVEFFSTLIFPLT